MKTVLFLLSTLVFSNYFSQKSEQISQDINQYLLNMKESEGAIFNIYFKVNQELNFEDNYRKYGDLLRLKKNGLKKIQKLNEDISAYGSDSKIKEMKEFYKFLMENTAFSFSKTRLTKGNNQKLFSMVDTNDTPLLWVIANNHPKLIYKSKANSQLLSCEWPYNSKLEKKILKLVEKSSPLEFGEKKLFIEQQLSLNDRYFELEKTLMNEELIIKNINSDNFIITDLGGFYCGEVSNGKLNGFGILFNSKGDTVFIGKWNDNFPNLMNGKLFQYHIEKNEVYLSDSTKLFISYSPIGDTYCGKKANNNSHNGQGEFIWTNDNAYSGDWSEGERTGLGSFFWANGYFYHGDFIKGKRSGNGKFYFTNGEIWDGYWVDGEFSGIGKKMSKEGDLLNKGLYEKGQLIKSNATREIQKKIIDKKEIKNIKNYWQPLISNVESGATDVIHARSIIQTLDTLVKINKVISQVIKDSIQVACKVGLVALDILQRLNYEKYIVPVTNGKSAQNSSWLTSYVVARLDTIILDLNFKSTELTNSIIELEAFSLLIDANKIISEVYKDSIQVALKVSANILHGLSDKLPATQAKGGKTVQEFETWLTIYASWVGYSYIEGSAKDMGNNIFEGKIKYGTFEITIQREWDGVSWVK